MLELFPEGFEERRAAGLASSSRPTPSRGEERLWQAFGTRPREDVAAGWEDAWRAFHRPVRVGALWVGPPWERPPTDALAVVIDPGRAFGTGAHPTTRLCLELLAGARAREPRSTSAAAPACSRSRPRSSASRRSSRIDDEPAASRRRASERRGERGRRSTPASADDAASPLRGGRRRAVGEHLARTQWRPWLRAACDSAASSPPATSPPTAARSRVARHVERAAARRLGGATCSSARSRVTRRRWRRSRSASSAARSRTPTRRRSASALLARRPRRARPQCRGRRREHVLRHARGGREVAPGGRPRGAHAPRAST